MLAVAFLALVAVLCFWGLWRRGNLGTLSVTVPKPRRRRQWAKPVPLVLVPGIPFGEIEPSLDLDTSYPYQRMDTPFYFGDGYNSGQGVVKGESAITSSLDRTIVQSFAFSTTDTILIANAEDFGGPLDNHLDHSTVSWTRHDVLNSTFMEGADETDPEDYFQEESSVDLDEFMVGCSTTPIWETPESGHGSGICPIAESAAHRELDLDSGGDWETESELSGSSWETESEHTDSDEDLIWVFD